MTTHSAAAEQKAIEAEIPERKSVVDDFAGYSALRRRVEDMEGAGLDNPFFQPRDGVSHSVIRRHEKSLISFSGYNYLGLNGHPAVTAAAKTAIDKYGTSASASRIVAGQIDLHGELERKLANFLGTEDALILISGYLTNVSVISHLLLSQWRLGRAGRNAGQGSRWRPPRPDRGRRRLQHGRPDPGPETGGGNQEAPRPASDGGRGAQLRHRRPDRPRRVRSRRHAGGQHRRQ